AFDLAGGRVGSSGSIAPAGLKASLEINGIPAGIVPRCPEALRARPVHARAWLSGTPAAPRLTAEALVTDIVTRRADGQPLPPLTLSAHLDSDGRRFNATLDAVGWPFRLLRVTAAVPVPPHWLPWRSPSTVTPSGAAPWRVGLLADADVEALGAFWDTDGVHLRGALSCDLAVSDPFAAPRLEGELILRDGYAECPATGTVLRDIELRAVGQDDRLWLREGRAGDAERGRLEFGGGVHLAEHGAAPRADIAIKANQAVLWRSGGSRLTFSGQGALTGRIAAPALTGAFEIVDSRILLDRTRPEIVTVPVTGLESRNIEFRPAPDKLGGALALDLDIRTGKPVPVEGRGLLSAWEAEAHVGGDTHAPQVRGGATMRHGSFYFMGRKFDLARAAVQLDGAYPPAPRISGEANARAGEMTAHMRVSGPMSQPLVDLSSTPDLPAVEIVSRLLFGRSSESISPFQGARLAYGLEVLRGRRNALELLDRGQTLLHADQIEFTQDEESGDSAVSVGKRLNSRVTVRGEKGVGGTGDRVAVEIEVLPELILETGAGTGMREGAGIRWRRDY
ncbi:MAG: translocation/assembly module TamB domain-containing protein, partial [Kiritimatiellae bacterium]|nr:translocation/assembly module TamB domain-containing protein [Kiritimatiellia bacterium]